VGIHFLARDKLTSYALVQIGSDFTLNETFIIPPERSSVDIIVNILGDMVAENDESILVRMMAQANQVFIMPDETSRTVTLTVLDDEGRTVLV